MSGEAQAPGLLAGAGQPVHIDLPDHFDLVVGDTFQLFYRGVVQAPNPYVYDIVSTCEVGRNFPRYFELTPERAGRHRLVVSLYDHNKALLGQAATLLRVHVAPLSAGPLQLLCVGDSLTANGLWPRELHRRLAGFGGEPPGLGLSRIRRIGTCGEGEARFEGYGGWSWDQFIQRGDPAGSAIWVTCEHDKTDGDQHSVWQDEAGGRWQLETVAKGALKLNRCPGNTCPKPEGGWLLHAENAQNREPVRIEKSDHAKANPFFSDASGQLDFAQYCRDNAFDGIDLVYILLSWNGLTEQNIQNADHVVARGKVFVDRLHQQYPKAKVRLMGLQVPSVNGGTGANYGASPPYCDAYALTRWVFRLNRAYGAWAREAPYREYLKFIHLSGQFDSEYNMPGAQKPANTRCDVTETVGTNGVHPAPDGYLQIADAAFRSAVADLTEE